MTPKQEDYYKSILGSAPSWVRYKIREGLPPSKQESTQLNAYLSGVRQLSNTTKAFQTKGDEHAPKIDMAVSELRKALKENPQAKAVVYSNYLESGINPYKERLEKDHIPYGVFTGGLSNKQRKQLVEDYNTGKIKALLLSSAGGEGLDLKGTRLMQILDPHFNNEKLRQVIGRGVRYKSHEGLPEQDQNVRVQKFLTRHPEPGGFRRLLGAKRHKSVDEYLTMMSADKDALHQQFREIFDAAQQDVNKQFPAEKAASFISRVENSVEEITKQSAAPSLSALAKNLKKTPGGERLWRQRPALIGNANAGKRRLMDPGTENNSRRLAKDLL
jgi:superfamily II DNA/RNA helicase